MTTRIEIDQTDCFMVPIIKVEKRKDLVSRENARFKITQFQPLKREHVLLVFFLDVEMIKG